MSKKTVLIVGGSSGLGLELARILSSDYRVIVTGRNDPCVDFLEFHTLSISRNYPNGTFEETLQNFIKQLPVIDLFIYAAGYYEELSIKDETVSKIEDMILVTLTTPALMLRQLLSQQVRMESFVAITSTSHFTPREKEPVYAAAKAGLAMLANSVALDPSFGKVLVAAPGGMGTNFWKKANRELQDALDPVWVAKQILEQLNQDFRYKEMRLLRNPVRVEIHETRNN